VARKEHGEFSSNIDLIDALPPGLYEAVFTAKDADASNPDLITGEWVMRCEPRTVDDIRALGGNDAADERRFATAARISEINLVLYRTFAQPVVRAMVLEPVAEWLRRLHPLRLQYELFSDKNLWMAPIAKAADTVRQHRQPAPADNPLVSLQNSVSDAIVAGLEIWRDLVETTAERTFRAVYGSPVLQAAVGIDPAESRQYRKAGKDPLHRKLVAVRVAELRSRIATGSALDGAVRALIYVGMARGSAEERGFEAIRRLRADRIEVKRPSLAEFKAMVREQYSILLLDREAAVAAIPTLVRGAEARRRCIATVHEVLSAAGEITGEVSKRLERIAQLLQVDVPRGAAASPGVAA
jgi:hypothetical protein